jgi:hypothetical protein
MCTRNWDTNRQRWKEIEHFLKGKCIEELQAKYMTMKKKIGGY